LIHPYIKHYLLNIQLNTIKYQYKIKEIYLYTTFYNINKFNKILILIKRTDIPNTNTILRVEGLFASGNPLTMPRRMALPSPSKDNLNYPNQQAALEEMQKEPGFGQQPENIYGKVWWDK